MQLSRQVFLCRSLCVYVCLCCCALSHLSSSIDVRNKGQGGVKSKGTTVPELHSDYEIDVSMGGNQDGLGESLPEEEVVDVRDERNDLVTAEEKTDDRTTVRNPTTQRESSLTPELKAERLRATRRNFNPESLTSKPFKDEQQNVGKESTGSKEQTPLTHFRELTTPVALDGYKNAENNTGSSPKVITFDHPDIELDNTEESAESEDEGCPTCGSGGLTEGDVKELRLDMFANVLRQKLRLYKANFSEVGELKLPKLPDAVMEQTFKDDRNVEEKYDFYARDEEVIITGDDIGHECVKMNANALGCYTFDLKGKKVKRGIDSAILWFYKTKDRHDVNKHELLIYELGLRRRFSGRLKEKSIISRKELYIKDGWISMDLTQKVRKWVDNGADARILAIKCNTCATKHYKALYGVKDGYKPIMVVKYLRPKKERRVKRTSESCDPRSECCKRHLVANFDSINMHYIIRPKNMSIGYCYGSCDSYFQHTFNHSAIIQRMRWNQPMEASLKEQLKPCCVPIQLKDATILTIEDGAIVRKMLPNVIVERCGCM